MRNYSSTLISKSLDWTLFSFKFKIIDSIWDLRELILSSISWILDCRESILSLIIEISYSTGWRILVSSPPWGILWIQLTNFGKRVLRWNLESRDRFHCTSRNKFLPTNYNNPWLISYVNKNKTKVVGHIFQVESWEKT